MLFSMKKDIHPKYYKQSTITCSCGNVVTAGSTQKAMVTELCSNCHPLYTGKQRIVDTAGKVEKFEARLALTKKMKEMREKSKKKQTVKKIKKAKKGVKKKQKVTKITKKKSVKKS